jgi:transposase
VPRRYPAEFRRKVLDLVAADPPVAQVAYDLQISAQVIYTWRRQQLIDSGQIPSMTSTDHAELVAARKRIAELAIHRRAAELLGDVVPPKGTSRRSGTARRTLRQAPNPRPAPPSYSAAPQPDSNSSRPAAPIRPPLSAPLTRPVTATTPGPGYPGLSRALPRQRMPRAPGQTSLPPRSPRRILPQTARTAPPSAAIPLAATCAAASRRPCPPQASRPPLRRDRARSRPPHCLSLGRAGPRDTQGLKISCSNRCEFHLMDNSLH